MSFTHSGPAAHARGKPQADLQGVPLPGGLGKTLRCGLLAVSLIALAGCSAGFDKYFGTDKAPPPEADPQAKAKTATEESTEEAQEVPGKTGDYPNLGSVPQARPVRQSAQDQTQAVAQGLVADRQNARYTDEVIRREPVQATAPARPVIPGVAAGASSVPALPGGAPATKTAETAAAPAAAAPPAPPGVAAPPSLPAAAAPQPVRVPQPVAAAPSAPQPVVPAPHPVVPTPQPVQVPQPAAAPPVPTVPTVPTVPAAPPVQAGIQPAPQPSVPPVAPSLPAAASPLATAPTAPASVTQPPSVAPVAPGAATMAAVAQPQFQPPPPPVIPGQPPIGQPPIGQVPQAYPQQAYPQQPYPQQAYAQPAPAAAAPGYPAPYPAQAYPPAYPYPPAAYPQASSPPTQRPVLIPPPGYGSSAMAVPTPSPTAPYAQAAAPNQPPQQVLNPIRPPPAPISPALPQIASRAGGGYGDAVAEARARVGGPNDPASVAEARRRAAFGQGQQVGLILFNHGSASIGTNDRDLLQRVASMAQQNGAVVRVVGHASGRTGELDTMRHQNRNLDISQARASAAAAELNAAGLPVDRIVVEAKGDSEPIYSEAMPSGEAGNRRVDIFLQ